MGTHTGDTHTHTHTHTHKGSVWGGGYGALMELIMGPFGDSHYCLGNVHSQGSMLTFSVWQIRGLGLSRLQRARPPKDNELRRNAGTVEGESASSHGYRQHKDALLE